MKAFDRTSFLKPCLIVAASDAPFAEQVQRVFCCLGWDVYEARGGPEARRLARLLEADVVLLDADLPEESGWLTCDKLTREQPLIKVLLVTDASDDYHKGLAHFVGASALVHREAGVEPLLHEACGSLAAVG